MVESDFSDISSELIRTTVTEVVQNQLNSNQYKINIKSASQSGENNFIGIVYRVTFHKDDGTESETNAVSQLILKVAPQNLARREQFISRPCFVREIYMYNEVRLHKTWNPSKFECKFLQRQMTIKFINIFTAFVSGFTVFPTFRRIKRCDCQRKWFS